MIIFGVSPQYLTYLFEESKDYRFRLQGYGDLDKANEGLIKTNISQIYGFTYLSDSLPQDTSKLTRFLQRCDMVCDGSKERRFVFALKDDNGLIQYLRSLGLKNTSFYLSKFEILTDTFIRKDIFGTILESHLSPYNRNSRESIRIPTDLPLLRYIPILPTSITKILSEVKVRDTLEDTLIADPIISEFKEDDIHYLFRKSVIHKHFPEHPNNLPEITEFIESIKDTKIRLQYELLLKYILDRL